ncbi:MAG: hypothetical protein U9R19_12840 [Bacteroidota bacterium]|nr:hypothetical protein [Bacteroidota bacterium]
MVLFILIISGIHTSYANDNIIDLKKRVPDMQDDTSKVNVLLTPGEHYCSIENDKALMYLQEAFTISTSKKYTEGIGKSLLWHGRVYYYPLASKYLDKAKKVLETTNELNALAFTYFAKAEISLIMGDFIRALEMYKEAIELTEKTGIIITKLGLAVAQNRLGEPNAIEGSENALAMARNIDNPNLISHAYKILADIYHKIMN